MPSLWRRLAALASILLTLGVVVWSILEVLGEPLVLVAVVVLLGICTSAVWYAITRRGAGRKVAFLLAIAAIALLVAVVLGDSLLSILLRLAALVLAAGLGRFALHRDLRTLKQLRTPGTPVPAARRGVLIMNLKSGGGKAEKNRLEDRCRERGVEPVVLRPGDDLLQLAAEAIDRGADVVGMAGGDGSQALVASVASERGIPMVVVPAGTRNHLALDLGLDRADVVGALDAFGAAVETTMDLAEVNGRVFVNNVSLGLYASIVRSPEYRDAKVDTTMSALPQLLGPGTEPFDLRYDGPDGARHDGAHLIQISNGPYGTTMGGMGTRPRLDTGLLGITTLVVPDDKAAGALIRAIGAGHADRYEGLSSWNAPAFRIDSAGPVAVGLDGESMELDPPLEFTSRPGVLRVRRSEHAIGHSPAALASPWQTFLPHLWRIVRGGPVRIGA
ncbi:MAG TPA: diacylglycerol kinase family protein [Actinomycetota bacterium]